MNVGGHWPTKIAASFLPSTRSVAEATIATSAEVR
jgi:hypothetical protein